MRTVLTLCIAAIGVGLAQLAPELPSRWICVLLAVVAASAGIVLLLRKRHTFTWLVLSVALVFGISYALLRADLRMAQALPHEWEGRDMELVGIIDELPQADLQGVRFAFAVEQVLTPKATVPPRIALGWYKATIKELQGEPLRACALVSAGN